MNDTNKTWKNIFEIQKNISGYLPSTSYNVSSIFNEAENGIEKIVNDYHQQEAFIQRQLSNIDTFEKQELVNEKRGIFDIVKSYIPTFSSKEDKTKNDFVEIEQKSAMGSIENYQYGNYINQGVPTLSFFYSGSSMQSIPILNMNSVARLYSMYSQVQPVENAVNKVINGALNATLNIKHTSIAIKDGHKKETVEIINHRLLDVNFESSTNLDDEQSVMNILNTFETPNFYNEKNFSSLLRAILQEYLIVGNCFIVVEYAKGVSVNNLNQCTNSMIKSIRIAKSVDILQRGETIVNDVYSVPVWQETTLSSVRSTSIIYGEKENCFIDKNGNLRVLGKYLNPTGKVNKNIIELYHISNKSGNGIVGLSKLFSCIDAIDTYYLANVYTKSFFKNNGVPAGIITVSQHDPKAAIKDIEGRAGNNNNALGQNDKTNIENLLAEQLKGATNAGRTMLWTNPQFKIEYVPLANKLNELDLQHHLENCSNIIYGVFNISSSLISRKGEKYNINSEELRLYEEAVRPVLSSIADAFNDIFFRRNNLSSQGYCFEFDLSGIPIYQEKKIEVIEKMASIGYATVNELRAMSLLNPLEGEEGQRIVGKQYKIENQDNKTTLKKGSQ
jgi:HK97 family phage portal protein